MSVRRRSVPLFSERQQFATHSSLGRDALEKIDPSATLMEPSFEFESFLDDT